NLRRCVGHQPIVAIGATIIVTNEDGAVLLQRRSDFGTWGLPGGALEPGETLEETARRELSEETGLTADGLTLLGVFSGPEFFIEYPNGDQLHSVIVLYQAVQARGELRMGDGESLELAYFPLDALPEMEPRSAALLPHVLESGLPNTSPVAHRPAGDAPIGTE
ncbi:MAG TPA: NUDIX hydrolase, partial [Armatimonadota bacterium]|nr:NUDIX hydrolase [Armatimonadota bacterium]